MKKEFDIISIGDSTVDFFLDIEEASVNCKIDDKDCQLCFDYANKVPIKKVTKVSGVGNAANLAVGSSRLKLKTALYTILGNDESGQEIFNHFKKEGINPDYIIFDKKGGTNHSTVLNFQAERTILVFHEHRNYHLPKFAKTKWVYFSSLSAGHEKIHQPVINLIKKNKIKLGFNPGTFQLKEGLKVLTPIMKVTEAFILNKQEAQRLLKSKEEDIKKLLVKLHKVGPRIVVITDSQNGSYAYDGQTTYSQPIFDSPVVERTGAGDSFSTGFISALVSGNDIPTAMRWGTVNACSVVQKVGAQAGLLTRNELKKLLKKYSKVKNKII
ncbi:MAG: hypothetical protein CMI53_02350 [Parcubacteria group bacterium]|nr:hypothetical protein [Parcubacteria group bacterium]|tara:strand:- start:4855 stop:5835 length:981 start_codon:yes stop_codon:yes gene_type:complete